MIQFVQIGGLGSQDRCSKRKIVKKIIFMFYSNKLLEVPIYD